MTNMNHNCVYINLLLMSAMCSLFNCVVLTTSALMSWYSPVSNMSSHGTRNPRLDHQQNKHLLLEFTSISLVIVGAQNDYCKVLSYRGLSLSFMYF
jgi:hypothetical protein